MIKSSIKEINETIKTMLSYALTLSESQVPTIYELGHYLADNILTKVCLVVAIEKCEVQQTYTTTRHGNRTKNLFDLYNDHLKNHYPKAPDYDPHIKKLHEERNVYQHDVESFDMTMRQPRAKAYVDLVEKIMKTVGIIKSSEIIRPSSLSPFGGYNFAKQQIKTKETKYQKLHDLFKVKNNEDIYIKLENIIKEIFDLKKTLTMEGRISRGMRNLHNSKWDIQISRHGVSVHSNEKQQGYSLNEPNKNIDILEDFLQYYRECCENIDLNINP